MELLLSPPPPPQADSMRAAREPAIRVAGAMRRRDTDMGLAIDERIEPEFYITIAFRLSSRAPGGAKRGAAGRWSMFRRASPR
ncbi:hypothetical protein GCM10007933_09210 [Zoogloea oryzae]|uniref:Uncharacterized protein n=1 Tax=Zoogloea oryzae TaxID=310767 RepID=A0ABQ6F968_9RHOO|nr:hypothetical protein GCM10007933_09210 [Zoogloea oryzae]